MAHNTQQPPTVPPGPQAIPPLVVQLQTVPPLVVKLPPPPTRTKWDVLNLVIMPLILVLIASLLGLFESGQNLQFNQNQAQIAATQQANNLSIAATQQANNLSIANDQQLETTLQTYLDRISDLLLNPNVHNGSQQGVNVRILARARTLTVLRKLDGPRKAIVLKFLYYGGLIKRQDPNNTSNVDPIVNLNGADFSGVNLSDFELGGADLAVVNFSGANLSGADLSGAYLSNVNMSKAHMSGTVLCFAQLTEQANLSGADLSGAHLGGADLIRADLSNANLSNANLGSTDPTCSALLAKGAKLTGADLTNATLNNVIWKNTTCPDNTNSDTNGLNSCASQ